jgi:hypothetical protein
LCRRYWWIGFARWGKQIMLETENDASTMPADFSLLGCSEFLFWDHINSSTVYR